MQFPYRPKDGPRPAPLDDVPGPNDPRFATIRPFFMQRKNEAALRRQAHLDAHRRQVEAIADTKARRALEREEAERQRGIDEFWHAINRKVRPEPRKAKGTATREPEIGRSPRPSRPPIQLAAYPGPIMDRRGRISVFMSSTYLAAKTTEYGCMKRLSYYVTRPDHLEAEGSFFSNMGEDRHEIAIGMALVEDANRAARANAKVAVTHIVQLPHDVSPEERITILRLWCEEHLGVHDLPFVAAVHKPSADGDQRNFHGHVVSSFRPAYRTGRYAWRVGRAPRTDLDNPATFDEYRHDFATLMTAIVQIAGHDRVYTHLSHAGRGLKHKPTEKLGPQKTRQVRAGEYVAADARNARTIATNLALAEIDRIDERAARNRRRIARLATLRNLSLRALSSSIDLPGSREGVASRTLSQPRRSVLPVMTPALLAAAGRVAERKRSRSGGQAGEEAPALIDAPTLQAAATLDDESRLSTVEVPRMPVGTAPRTLSPPIDTSAVEHRSVRLPSQVDAVERGVVVSRTPSIVIAPERRVVVARALRVVPPVEPVRGDVRAISAMPSIRPAPVEARRLSDPAAVEPGPIRSRRPSRIVAVNLPPAIEVRCLSTVAEPAREPVEARRPVPIAAIEHDAAVAPVLTLSPAIRSAPRPIPAKRLSDLPMIGRAPDDAGRARTIDSARVTRLARLATDIERAAREHATAAAAREDADHRQRDKRRYLRFLALIALNPDWLADGVQGLELAPHAPAEMHAAYAAWSNDHPRRETITAVRQATLDGMHRLPPDLVREVERTAVALAPRLGSPPPLRDPNGRLSPAGTVILALVADRPAQVSASGDTTRLSPDAAPALRTLIARHAADRHLLELLATARQHGEGMAGAVGIDLTRTIDERRMGFALRRKAGPVPVLTPAGDRLSPAMLDHLAQARLHPEWIVHTSHLGMGPGASASRLFHDQWMAWSDPTLAKQLLIENADSAGQGQFLTSAMRAQVKARMETLARGGGTGGPAGIAPTIDRSR